MELYTERLILRTPSLDDSGDIQQAINYEAIAANTLNIPYPYPVDGARQWIESINPQSSTHYSFLIRRASDNVLLGSVTIGTNPDHKHGEIGYWVSQPYWGNGYASEALREMIRFGFAELGLHRIFGRYFADNPASGRVMEKSGMQYEGTLRQHILKWGEYKDLAIRSMLREEWQARPNNV